MNRALLWQTTVGILLLSTGCQKAATSLHGLRCAVGQATWACVDHQEAQHSWEQEEEWPEPAVARRHLEALAANPDEPRRLKANRLLGDVCEFMGDLLGSQEAYERAMELGDTDAMDRWTSVTERRGDCAGAHAKRLELASKAPSKRDDPDAATDAARRLLGCLQAKGDPRSVLESVRGPLAAGLENRLRKTFEVRALNALGRSDEAEGLWPSLRMPELSLAHIVGAAPFPKEPPDRPPQDGPKNAQPQGWVMGIDALDACGLHWEIDLAQDATPLSGHVLRLHHERRPRPRGPMLMVDDPTIFAGKDVGGGFVLALPRGSARWPAWPGYRAFRQAVQSLQPADCDLLPAPTYESIQEE